MPTRKRINSRNSRKTRKTRNTRKSRKTKLNKLSLRNRSRRRGRGKRHHRGSGGQGSNTAAVEEDELSKPQAPSNKDRWQVLRRQGSFNVTEAKDAAAAAAALKDRKVGLAGIGNIHGYLAVSPEEADRAKQERLYRVAKRQRAVDRLNMGG